MENVTGAYIPKFCCPCLNVKLQLILCVKGMLSNFNWACWMGTFVLLKHCSVGKLSSAEFWKYETIVLIEEMMEVGLLNLTEYDNSLLRMYQGDSPHYLNHNQYSKDSSRSVKGARYAIKGLANTFFFISIWNLVWDLAFLCNNFQYIFMAFLWGYLHSYII